MSVNRAHVSQRRERIIELIHAGCTQVDDLAVELGVSQVTVRRDLAHLAEKGRIARTYGGAAQPVSFTELGLHERMIRERPAKKSIGEAAAQFLPPDGAIFIDAGSTTAALVRHIPADSRLTVVTRSPEIAIILAAWPNLTVMTTGGIIAPMSHGMVGHVATQTIARYRYQVAFLGVDAVDPEFGVGEPTSEEAATKEVAASRAGRVVVLADHTKLMPSSISCWAAIPAFTLVTDERSECQPYLPHLTRFTTAGIDVVVAD